jgi:hypothetical protein
MVFTIDDPESQRPHIRYHPYHWDQDTATVDPKMDALKEELSLLDLPKAYEGAQVLKSFVSRHLKNSEACTDMSLAPMTYFNPTTYERAISVGV